MYICTIHLFATMNVSPTRKSIILICVLAVAPAITVGYASPKPHGTSIIAPDSQSVMLPANILSREDTVVETGRTTSSTVEPHNGKRRKWGIDMDNVEEYWFDQRIHTLGNIGLSGALHAAVAPFSTKVIDMVAYGGVDIRRKVADELSATVNKQKARVVDLCCGVGCSTRALRTAFPDSDVVGVDTSTQMVAMAGLLSGHIKSVERLFLQRAKRQHARSTANKDFQFIRANAEDTNLANKSCDLVTLFFAFHEVPMRGRHAMLKEAQRLLTPGGTLAVIDISTDYTPSDGMLKGEPYIQEYQEHIQHQLESCDGFNDPKYQTIVPQHLGMWTLTRSKFA